VWDICIKAGTVGLKIIFDLFFGPSMEMTQAISLQLHGYETSNPPIK
jgi:hypothetical protein